MVFNSKDTGAVLRGQTSDILDQEIFLAKQNLTPKYILSTISHQLSQIFLPHYGP